MTEHRIVYRTVIADDSEEFRGWLRPILDGGADFEVIGEACNGKETLEICLELQPDLLIMDEPSSGLDAVVRRDILNAIVRTVADDGRTVIFSSHLLEEVERMSDHLTMIHDGRVVFDGRLEAIKQRYQHTKIRFAERQSAARPSMRFLKSTGSTATRTRICAVSWIMTPPAQGSEPTPRLPQAG